MKETYKAAVCIGRQPNSDVWVFGENLQLNGDGTLTNPETSSFMWVKQVFSMEENGRRKEHTVGPTPDIRLRLYGHVLHDVVKGLIKTVHDNTMAAIFTIGMSIIFVFYSFSIHHTRPLNYFVNNT